MLGIKGTRSLLVIFLSLPIASCKKEWNWVAETEWSGVGIVFNVLTFLAGAAIAWFVRMNVNKQQELEKERVAREEKLEEERIAREEKLEKERADREEKLEKERVAREKELEDARVAREKAVQEVRDRLEAFDGYRRELGRFADGVFDVVAEVQTLIAFNPDRAAVPAQARQQFVEERSRLIGRVSSLVDRGRFFFPNREAAGIGMQQGTAQQGQRDPVLNRILALGHIVRAIDYADFDNNSKEWIRWRTLTTVAKGRKGHVCSAFGWLSKAEQGRLASELKKRKGIALMDLTDSAKRAFVSEVFSILQPQNWLEQVEKAYGINLLSRKPEGAVVHVDGA